MTRCLEKWGVKYVNGRYGYVSRFESSTRRIAIQMRCDDVVQSKSTGECRTRNIQKRHETCREIKAAMNCRNPKYSKAARGRAALRNISKRRETRRTPKAVRASGSFPSQCPFIKKWVYHFPLTYVSNHSRDVSAKCKRCALSRRPCPSRG